MQLHFEAGLDYQLAAMEAVCGLFQGQDPGRPEEAGSLALGNRLNLRDEEILANLNSVQLRNRLPPRRPWTRAISPWRWRRERAKPTST